MIKQIKLKIDLVLQKKIILLTIKYKTFQFIKKEYNNDIYGASLQEEDNLTVTVKSLVRDNYLEPITDIKDESITCSGYVTFIKKGVNVTYSPYLKCGTKYTTKGYLERLDAEV